MRLPHLQSAACVRSLGVVCALAVGFGAGTQVRSAARSPSYGSMAPIDRYMSADRDAEIRLARSAAPGRISRGASVLVLRKDGYDTAVRGTNGFTCLVERSWMAPFDGPEFWNPRVRGPICYNPPAVRSILPYTIFRTELVMRGLDKTQMHARILATLARHALPAPENGAMSYMLSKNQYLGDSVGHWCPHLMFHIRKTDAADWGANLEGSPVMFDSRDHDMPEPETIFMLAAPRWSDGSDARAEM